mmetsp:Transcript_15103/g.48358  ORF Transcript_15103/g.48358 Transcript_15103/m.48358 type:complete len:229 (-) Transcript_15103:345-1031(-)
MHIGSSWRFSNSRGLALHEAHDHRDDLRHVTGDAGADLRGVRHGLHDAIHEARLPATHGRGGGGRGGEGHGVEHAGRGLGHLVAELALQTLEECVRLGAHVAVVGGEAAAEVHLQIAVPILECRHTAQVELELLVGPREHLLVKLPHVRQARRQALRKLPRQHRLVSLLLCRLTDSCDDLLGEAEHAAVAVLLENAHRGLLLRGAQREQAHLVVGLRLLLQNRIPDLA